MKNGPAKQKEHAYCVVRSIVDQWNCSVGYSVLDAGGDTSCLYVLSVVPHGSAVSGRS